MTKFWRLNYVCVVWFALFTTGTYGAKKPSIILMIADDLGYGDLGCYGNTTIRTPNIDRLAEDGVKMTHALAPASICTPSRAAFLTGRYHLRSGMAASRLQRVFTWLAIPKGLPSSEITIGELTKHAGYQNGFIGKWHLGVSKDKFGDHVHHPLKQGFDYYYGNLLSNIDDFGDDGVKLITLLNPAFNWQLLVIWSVTVSSLCCLYQTGYLNLIYTITLSLLWAIPWFYLFFIYNNMMLLNGMVHRNFDIVEQPIQLVGMSKRLVQEGTEFMSRAVERDSPYLLVISWFHAHTALRVSKEFEGKSRYGIYGDAIEEMDWSVGKLLEHLDKIDDRDNTLVMFISDHGAHVEQGIHGGTNGMFRGGKTHGAPEGAIRVPWIVRWPGLVPAGVIIDEPVSLMDIFLLVGQAANVPLPTDRTIDGKNILPLLQGKEQVSPHEFLFHYCGDRLHATRYRPRSGNFVWKLVTHFPRYLPGLEQCVFGCGCDDAITLEPPKLYDIRSDPRELAPLEPHSDVYKRVRAIIEEAVEGHEKSLEKVETQFRMWDNLWHYSFQECCSGTFPFNCKCTDPTFSADMYT